MSDSRSKDRALVERLLTGDEAAFSELVQSLHAGLVALARAYVRSKAVAEEVVQEAWITVIAKLGTFEHRSALKTWISGIVVNKAKNRGVREARTMPFSSLGESESAVDVDAFSSRGAWLKPVEPFQRDAEDRLFTAERMRFVAAELEKLPDVQRAVVTLRHVSEWSAEEVCEALGITDANQRVLLHRGRSRLRKALAAHLEET